jgi:hypothetical protein
MVLGKPMLWAVIVLTIVALEGKIDFCPALSAFHKAMLLGSGKYETTPHF